MVPRSRPAFLQSSAALGLPCLADMDASWDEALQELLDGWDAGVQNLLEQADDDVFLEDVPVPLPPPVDESWVNSHADLHKQQVPHGIVAQLQDAAHHLHLCPLQPLFEQILTHPNPDADVPQPAGLSSHLIDIAKFYCHADAKLHASKEAVSRIVGVAPAQLDDALAVFTNTLIHLSRATNQQIEQILVNSQAELLMYAEVSRYDETPMKVAHTQSVLQDSLAADTAGDFPAAASGWSSAHAGVGVNTAFDYKSSGLSKMFSTESKYVMVTKLPVEGPTGLTEQFFVFTGQHLTWNQLLNRATAPVMMQAIAETAAVTKFANQFALRVRAATTDQASANILLEKTISEAREGSWCNLHLLCNAHHCARVHSKSLTLLEQHISGLVNYALSLSLGSSMFEFRKALARVIDRMPLVVRRGAPPQEVVEYQTDMLKLFCASGTRSAERHFLLTNLCNGYWRNTEQLEIYLDAGVEFEAKQVKANLLRALLVSLAHKNFSLYPRHRWIGCDVATDEVGLCLCIHGVGAAAFEDMCREIAGKGQPAGPAGHILEEAAPADQPPAELLLAASFPSDTLATVPDEDIPMGPLFADDQEPEHLHPADEGQPDKQQAMAAENARARKRALEWLAGRPFGSVMMLRLALKPLCKLLGDYIDRSGHRWELEQRAAVAQMEEAAPGSSVRTTPVQQYVNLVSEKRFLAELEALRSPQTWRWLPRHLWTLEQQCLAFRLLSRMGCLVHQLLIVPTQSCPLLLFKLLDEEHVATDIQALPPCMLDSFSSQFVKRFPADTLRSTEARTCLTALSLALKTETVQVEWGHSAMHRLISTSSVHTHTPQMKFVNAQWVLQRYSQRRYPPQSRRTSARKTLPKPVPSGKPSARAKGSKRKGGGGSWRAWVNKAARGSTGVVDFQALSATYRQARQEQSEAFTEAAQRGAAATARLKEGASSGFGKRLRQVLCSRDRAASSSAATGSASAKPLLGEVVASASPPLTVALQQQVEQRLTQVRAVAKRASKTKRAEASQRQQILAKHVDRDGQRTLEALLGAIPELLSLSGSLQPVPHPEFSCVDVNLELEQQAVAVGTWAASRKRSSNLSAVLSDDWSHKNRLISQAPTQPVAAAQPRQKQSCLTRGFCTCTWAGKQTFRLYSAFLQHLKAQFSRRDMHSKHTLLDGFVIVRLTGQQEQPDEDESWQQALGDLLGEEVHRVTEERLCRGQLWLHVGLQYLKPYRPTLQVLDFVRMEPRGRVVLRQTGRFQQALDTIAKLSLKSSWEMEFFKMLSFKRPLALFEPDLCLVEAQTEDPVRLWPLERKRRGRRARSVRADNVSGDLEALSQAGVEAAPPTPEAGLGEQDAASEGSEVSDATNLAVSSEEESNPEEAEETEFDELLDMLFAVEAEPAHADDEMQQPEPVRIPSPAPSSAQDESGGEQPPVEPRATAGPEQGDSGSSTPPAPDAAPPAEPPRGAEADAADVIPDVAVARARAVAARSAAELVLEIDGGVLSYYRQGIFTATCSNPLHHRCVLTRTARAGRAPAQGRPLGLLASWLAMGTAVESKEEHWDKTTWPSFEDRRAAREALAQQDDAWPFFGFERAEREGEGAEPLLLP